MHCRNLSAVTLCFFLCHLHPCHTYTCAQMLLPRRSCASEVSMWAQHRTYSSRWKRWCRLDRRGSMIFSRVRCRAERLLQSIVVLEGAANSK